MADITLHTLLQHVADDVAALPVSAVQLVGALVSMQHDLPPALSTFIMAQLSLRAEMSEVSPAAEAMMRISAFAAYNDREFAKLEIRNQQAFLKAIAMDDQVRIATAFMARLANRLADTVLGGGDGN